MTIERDRSAALPSPKDALETHLLRDLRAVGLPEPVRELHFMWCCEHPKAVHRASERSGLAWCSACEASAESRGWAYRHGFQRDRDFRFDFAWPDDKLAVEVDGGTFSGGRHTRGAGYAADAEKLNEAVLRGWKVLRVTSKQVEDGSALEWIERAFGRTGEQ